MDKLDLRWLERVGTAYALASCSAEETKIFKKIEDADLKAKKIESALNEENDPDGELDVYLQVLQGNYVEDLHSRLSGIRAVISNIESLGWIEPETPISDAAWREIGLKSTLTKEEFLHRGEL